MFSSIKPSLIVGSIDQTQDGIHTLDFTSHVQPHNTTPNFLTGRQNKERKTQIHFAKQINTHFEKLLPGSSKLTNNPGHHVLKAVLLFNRDVTLLPRRNFLEESNMYRRKTKNYLNCPTKLTKKHYRQLKHTCIFLQLLPNGRPSSANC